MKRENYLKSSLYKKISEEKCLAIKFKYDAERKKNCIKFGGGLHLNKNVFIKGMVKIFFLNVRSMMT
jgi:hypothetical protein